ncbi:MAG: hypothetical protein GTO55_05785 [Armatimonadetes bacterium]|nr:hypothetical protein [Armatimonadota bacterium]NIM23764.1 hypothetical protein [Armatimonadota bacterium]NIM67641.1 hypothetical protein [Armatimonadota bacterium]NIM76157.1 hypothetical protein [Armatimonadota bacterium]NIN05842.1 hypothetical protein [Armatimonadota bacterium]
MKRFGVLASVVGWIILLALLAASPGVADKTVIINNYGATPFIYGGYSYIPLRSASDFLGAALLWDSIKKQAVITYDGKDLALNVGSPTAYYAGAPVYLPVAPVIIDGRAFIPTTAIRHFGVPVEWHAKERKVRIRGREGWGAIVIPPHTPPHVLRIMKQQGTPPWAGGPGQRAAPPPGLATKAGGLPPGQAKKGVVVIQDKGKAKGKDNNKDKGKEKGQNKDNGD